jgi:hypothetical protein
MAQRTSSQELALRGMHIVGGAILGLLFAAALLWSPEIIAWWSGQ